MLMHKLQCIVLRGRIYSMLFFIYTVCNKIILSYNGI